MINIIFRADATSTMGTGHVMRCLAIALRATQLRCNVYFVGYTNVPWIKERIVKNFKNYYFIKRAPEICESATCILQDLNKANFNFDLNGSWIVLDGYHFSNDSQKLLRSIGVKIVVIDDFAHLNEYTCDILLNQNIGADELDYQGYIGVKLIGLKYALLRPEFRYGRKYKSRNINKKTLFKSVLISLGGGDFLDILQYIVSILSDISCKNVKFYILCGNMPREKVFNVVGSAVAKFTIFENVNNMRALFNEVDLCITAGGSTCWELACCGVPFLTIQIAENQKYVCRILDERDYALKFSKYNFEMLLNNEKIRQKYSKKITKIVDGLGATRLLNCMIHLL